MSAEDNAAADQADIGDALVAALGFEPADGRQRSRKAGSATTSRSEAETVVVGTVAGDADEGRANGEGPTNRRSKKSRRNRAQSSSSPVEGANGSAGPADETAERNDIKSAAKPLVSENPKVVVGGDPEPTGGEAPAVSSAPDTVVVGKPSGPAEPTPLVGETPSPDGDRAAPAPQDPPMAAAAAVTGDLATMGTIDQPPPPTATDAVTVVVEPESTPSSNGGPADATTKVEPGEAAPSGPPVIPAAGVAGAAAEAKVDLAPGVPDSLPAVTRIETRDDEIQAGRLEAEARARADREAAARQPQTQSFSNLFRRTRRLQSRKVRRVVRHIDPWSVLTFSVLFHLCVFAALLLASVLVWNAAEAAGTIENLETFILELGDYETFEIKGDVVFQAAVAIAGILTLASSVLLVLLTVVFNLISDLVGGIRITVIEEETVRVRRRQVS
jgi:hypothetical protein